jgi:hypothetical protein
MDQQTEVILREVIRRLAALEKDYADLLAEAQRLKQIVLGLSPGVG